MSALNFERDIEWERGAYPIVLDRGPFPQPFLEGVKKITIARNDDMALQLVAEGILTAADEARIREIGQQREAGSFLDPVNFEFNVRRLRCRLNVQLDSEPENVWYTREPTKFTQRGWSIAFSQSRSTKTVIGDNPNLPKFVPIGEEAWRSDWFINGPREHFFRGTTRQRTGTFVRERSGAKIVVNEVPTGGSQCDHFLVEAAGFRFAACKVPEEFAPPWCQPFCIEFSDPVPDPSTRDAVAELVSFVFGRRLMPIGSTSFDATGWPIEQAVRDPWGQHVRGLCENGGVPTIPISPLSHDPEVILTELLPLYLAKREQLRLRDALLMYWLANESGAGFDLAIYGAAVESLKHAWFARAHAKNKGEHMSRDELQRVLEGHLEPIRQRLSEAGAPAAVFNRILTANRMGVGEQMNAFAAEIGLEIGTLEHAAIKARNTPAHGGLKAGMDLKALVRHGWAYRCLFERAFLKVLGYDGNYTDRACAGHPARPIDEPCGGR